MKSKGRKFSVTECENGFDFNESSDAVLCHLTYKSDSIYLLSNTENKPLFTVKIEKNNNRVTLVPMKNNQENIPTKGSTKKPKNDEIVGKPLAILHSQPNDYKFRIDITDDTFGEVIEVVFTPECKAFHMETDKIICMFNAEELVGFKNAQFRVAGGERRNFILGLVSMIIVMQKEAVTSRSKDFGLVHSKARKKSKKRQVSEDQSKTTNETNINNSNNSNRKDGSDSESSEQNRKPSSTSPITKAVSVPAKSKHSAAKSPTAPQTASNGDDLVVSDGPSELRKDSRAKTTKPKHKHKEDHTEKEEKERRKSTSPKDNKTDETTTPAPAPAPTPTASSPRPPSKSKTRKPDRKSLKSPETQFEDNGKKHKSPSPLPKPTEDPPVPVKRESLSSVSSPSMKRTPSSSSLSKREPSHRGSFSNQDDDEKIISPIVSPRTRMDFLQSLPEGPLSTETFMKCWEQLEAYAKDDE